MVVQRSRWSCGIWVKRYDNRHNQFVTDLKRSIVVEQINVARSIKGSVERRRRGGGDARCVDRRRDQTDKGGSQLRGKVVAQVNPGHWNCTGVADRQFEGHIKIITVRHNGCRFFGDGQFWQLSRDRFVQVVARGRRIILIVCRGSGCRVGDRVAALTCIDGSGQSDRRSFAIVECTDGPKSRPRVVVSLGDGEAGQRDSCRHLIDKRNVRRLSGSVVDDLNLEGDLFAFVRSRIG